MNDVLWPTQGIPQNSTYVYADDHAMFELLIYVREEQILSQDRLSFVLASKI